jgi:hypothetical protein
MTRETKMKKPLKKKPIITSYRKKLLEKNAIENTQRYYITSILIPPVGNLYSWNVKEERVFDEVITDPFCIGFDPEEVMSFLPEIPK